MHAAIHTETFSHSHHRVNNLAKGEFYYPWFYTVPHAILNRSPLANFIQGALVHTCRTVIHVDDGADSYQEQIQSKWPATVITRQKTMLRFLSSNATSTRPQAAISAYASTVIHDCTVSF